MFQILPGGVRVRINQYGPGRYAIRLCKLPTHFCFRGIAGLAGSPCENDEAHPTLLVQGQGLVDAFAVYRGRLFHQAAAPSTIATSAELPLP